MTICSQIMQQGAANIVFLLNLILLDNGVFSIES